MTSSQWRKMAGNGREHGAAENISREIKAVPNVGKCRYLSRGVRVKPTKSDKKRVIRNGYANRRDFKKTSENLSQNIKTLYNWADRYGWHGRACQTGILIVE